MFDKTADIAKIKEYSKVCFGSDSTLTSQWDIWTQINQAGKLSNLPAGDMLNTLNRNPATLWKLNGGYISENKDADIVVVKKRETGHVYSIKAEDILLVMHKGEPVLFDEILLKQQIAKDILKQGRFQSIWVGTSIKHVKGDIQTLITQIRKYLPNYAFPFQIAK